MGGVFAKNTSLETKFPSPFGSEHFLSLDWYFGGGVCGHNFESRHSKEDSDQLWFKVIVFNATFNNISVISWRSVLLMEEFWYPRNRHWQTNSPDFGISYSLKYCLLDLFVLEMNDTQVWCFMITMHAGWRFGCYSNKLYIPRFPINFIPIFTICSMCTYDSS